MKEKRKIVLWGLFLYIIIMVIIIYSTSIETAYYISQIFVILVIVSTAIIALMQYIESVNSNKSIEEVRFIENAIDLSRYYKDYILSNAGFIEALYEVTGITKILEKSKNCKYFNNKELKDTFSDEEIKKLKNIDGSKEFIDNAHKLYSLFFNKKICSDSDVITKEERSRSYILTKDVIGETLNCMEYFAMSFTHNTADESVVFESLAPSYVKLVNLLYYQISINNNIESESTYYTNVISLYKQWMTKIEKKQSQIQSTQMSLCDEGTIHNKK